MCHSLGFKMEIDKSKEEGPCEAGYLFLHEL